MPTTIKTIPAGGTTLSIPGLASSITNTGANPISLRGRNGSIYSTLTTGQTYNFVTFQSTIIVESDLGSSVSTTYVAPAVNPLPGDIQVAADLRYAPSASPKRKEFLHAFATDWSDNVHTLRGPNATAVPNFPVANIDFSKWIDSRIAGTWKIVGSEVEIVFYGYYKAPNAGGAGLREVPIPTPIRIWASFETTRTTNGTGQMVGASTLAGDVSAVLKPRGILRMRVPISTLIGADQNLMTRAAFVPLFSQGVTGTTTSTTTSFADSAVSFNGVARSLGRANLNDLWIIIDGGDGVNQTRRIISHTDSTITLNSAFSTAIGTNSTWYLVETVAPATPPAIPLQFGYNYAPGAGGGGNASTYDGAVNCTLGGATLGTAPGRMFSPMIEATRPLDPTVQNAYLACADSQADGVGDLNTQTNGGFGPFTRSMGFKKNAFANMAIPSMKLSEWASAVSGGVAPQTAMRDDMGRYFVNAIIQAGINDAAFGVSSDSAANRLAAMKANFRRVVVDITSLGNTVWFVTPMARAVSNDVFSTLAGQTPNIQIDADTLFGWNTYVRSPQVYADNPELRGMMDVGGTVTVADGGMLKWKAPTIIRTTGTAFTSVALQGAITDNTKDFVALGVLPGDTFRLFTGTDAGRGLQIVTVTTNTITTASGTTVAYGTGNYQIDRGYIGSDTINSVSSILLHPGRWANEDAQVPIDAWKLANNIA